MPEPRKRPRKQAAPKPPQPRYPDLIPGLQRLGLPSDPEWLGDLRQNPTYHGVLTDLLAETK